MSGSSKYCVLAETQIFVLKTRDGVYLPQNICKYMGFADGRPSMMHGTTAHGARVLTCLAEICKRLRRAMKRQKAEIAG